MAASGGSKQEARKHAAFRVIVREQLAHHMDCSKN